MTLQEVQRKTTSREFLQWMAFLNLQVESTDKTDYLFASVAMEIRKGYVKDASKVNIEDVILKLKAKKPEIDEEEDEELHEEELKRRTKNSKASWFGFLGIK